MLLFVADNMACFPYQSQEEPLFIMHHIDITLSVSGSNLLQTFKEVGTNTSLNASMFIPWSYFAIDMEFCTCSVQLLLKEPRRKEKKVKVWKNPSDGENEEERMNCDSPRSDGEENSDNDGVVRQPKKARQPVVDPESSESESDLDDLDLQDVEKVMRLVPDNPIGLLDFANAVQGILLLLVLKQHLKNQYGFSDG